MPSSREGKHKSVWPMAEAILRYLFRSVLQAIHTARAGARIWPWGSTNAVNKNP